MTPDKRDKMKSLVRTRKALQGCEWRAEYIANGLANVEADGVCEFLEAMGRVYTLKLMDDLLKYQGVDLVAEKGNLEW